MATVPETQVQSSRAPMVALSRMMAVGASLGCLTTSLLLVKVVPIFGGLFNGLVVELPFATRFVVTHNGWIAAMFVCGALLLPIFTEFVNPATRRMIVTGSAFAASSASVVLVVFTMYLPLFELIRKLGQTK